MEGWRKGKRNERGRGGSGGGRDAVLAQDRLGGQTLEALAEQVRVEDHLAGGDAAQAQAPEGAVDVAHDQVDVGLGEAVEGDSVLEDAADVAVGALDVGLLRGAVGVGVEHPNGAVGRSEGGDGLLDAGRIGELASVVGEDDREEPLEQLGPRDAPEDAEEARGCVGGPPPAQEGEHEAAGQPDGEEDLASDAPDDGVDLGAFLDAGEAAMLDELPVGAADALLAAWAPGAGFGEVAAANRPACNGAWLTPPVSAPFSPASAPPPDHEGATKYNRTRCRWAGWFGLDRGGEKRVG